MGLRHRGVNVISCPSCARQGFNVIDTVEKLEERLAHITTPMSLSVIGCVVNGPGEARETDIAFTGGGAGKEHGMIYLNGEIDTASTMPRSLIIWLNWLKSAPLKFRLRKTSSQSLRSSFAILRQRAGIIPRVF
ncbi:(E)-4-hydroxy-3-methylbut-2-enyl-diphosphate synthase (flavodoxin) [hydrothermal vent metagenome]|uniref:(E)-4-hydroxy-3-methylbut-2-enyl-diphosphate synthase (Flavodoxin) n=1 Tax=hydrothermal vent metagenome TaxID=652676 RepID=A0A3B0SVB7_9ZZZZ